jgi:hypothetical protein
MYEIIAAWCLHAKLFDRSTAGRPHTPSRLCLMPDLHGRVDRFAHVRAARMAWIALDSTRPASLDYCQVRTGAQQPCRDGQPGGIRLIGTLPMMSERNTAPA